jgi:hypothetical protein
MKREHYIPVVDDWYLGTDGISFTLLKKKVVADAEKAKEKNIGKERYDVMGYYATLGSFCAGLHRYLSMEVLARGGAPTLEAYVAELSKMVDRVHHIDASVIEMLQKKMGVVE